MKTPRSVAVAMPPNTAVPSARRDAAPAPVATTSGSTPSRNAKEVMRIGLKRKCAASSAALTIEAPCSRRSFANSTIKMAFFAASPISVMMPIWVYKSYGYDRMVIAINAPSSPSGTASTTANGVLQLSYSAARNSTTRIDAKPKMNGSAPSLRCC